MKTNPNRLIPFFALAAAIPLGLGLAGALAGGIWAWMALIWITLVAYALDRTVKRVTPATGPDGAAGAANTLSVALALGHFVLLFLTVWALARGGVGWPSRIALFFASGLFMGQVSNANAHELIHRGARSLHWLGAWVYISLLFGHHASAHPLVHHVHVATRRDPNTAREGEGFYRFAGRAWAGSFREGWRAETARRIRVERGGLHPYVVYLGGATALLAVSLALAGPAGLLAHLLLAAYATMQLLLSDYVQHYGLIRATGPDGRTEPVRPVHSWNAPHWYSSLMMLNAPRHSDHHAHPSRPYPALCLPDPGAAPVLPRPLPAMAALALVPMVWKRVMDRELARWRQAG